MKEIIFRLARKLCGKLYKLEQLRTYYFLPTFKGIHKEPYIRSRRYFYKVLFFFLEGQDDQITSCFKYSKMDYDKVSLLNKQSCVG